MTSIWLSKPMWRAVFLTILLDYLMTVAIHYAFQGVGDQFSNLMDEIPKYDEDEEDFNKHLHSFKMFETLAMDALLLPLQYRWQVWLESTFPSRPRAQAVEYKDKPMTDVNEAVEEEIMRRLIAEGKVQRASLRWGNVFIKLMIDYVFGTIIFQTLSVVTWKLRKLDPWAITVWNVGDAIATTMLGKLFTGWFVTWGINFVLVPVQHRLPFSYAFEIVCAVFLALFLKAVVPMVAKSETWKEGQADRKAQQEWLALKANKTTSAAGDFPTVQILLDENGDVLSVGDDGEL